MYCVFDNCDFGKLTYVEWVECLFNFSLDCEEKQKNEIQFFFQNITTIQNKAKLLKSTIGACYNNKYITDEFRGDLDSLIRYCSVMERDLKNGSVTNSS